MKLLLITSCMLLASCVSTGPWRNSIPYNGTLLTKVQNEDGTSQSWKIYADRQDNEGQSRLQLTGSESTIVAKIGVNVGPVTREFAKTRGATPFRGIAITRVTNNRPAQQAGIRTGDIILKVHGEDVTSPGQFQDLMATHAIVGVAMPISIFVEGKKDATGRISSPSEQTVMITPYGEKKTSSGTDSIPLSYSKGVQAFAGIQAVNIDSNLSRKVYDTDKAQVLIAGIVTGSEAYKAGLRSGDRIIKIDGKPVASLDDLKLAVRSRIIGSNNTPDIYDLALLSAETQGVEKRTDDIQIEVDGPLGAHEASFPINDEVTTQSNFNIPIVLGYKSNLSEVKMSCLNFIFQFGFNYRSQMHGSKTREPVETSKLSILPLGMFEVHHGLSGSSYRLFWLINFSSEN
jgi:PDZ domain-containing secreted protein